MKAIVYTSNTGTTEAYAVLLGEKTGLPVYALKEAKGKVAAGAEIIYLGWLMASSVQGYDKAAKQFDVKAVCGVCMGATGSQLEEIRTKNHIPPETPVFSMQGGFDMQKLHGMYKMMMKVMAGTVGKKLAAKENRTEEEDTMLDMLLHGADYVSEENMKELLAWYESEVREAIETGMLSEERFASYQKLKTENQYMSEKAAYMQKKKEKFKEIAKINRSTKKK